MHSSIILPVQTVLTLTYFQYGFKNNYHKHQIPELAPILHKFLISSSSVVGSRVSTLVRPNVMKRKTIIWDIQFCHYSDIVSRTWIRLKIF